MISEDYAINDIRRLSERTLSARHRLRRTANYQKCNCNKRTSITAMSKKVAVVPDTNHMIEDGDDYVPSLTATYPNVEATFILRNASHTTKSAILSVKTHKRSTDLNFLHFKSINLSPITSPYLSVAIGVLVWLISRLSCNKNTIDWRLHTNIRKSILHYFCIRYILICLVVTTSLAHEITLQQIQNNGKNLHTFRNNFSAAVTSQPGLKTISEDATTSAAGKLDHDFDSTGRSLTQSDSVSNVRITNLLSRDTIIQQHQQKSPSMALNKSPELSSTSTSTCSSCHAREKAKIDSLESIKVHILSQLRSPPVAEERSKRRDVPKNILDTYYSEYDHNGQRRDYKSKISQKGPSNFQKHPNLFDSVEIYENVKSERHDYDERMQSDDPSQFSAEDYEYEDEDQLYTHINSIYVFPIANKLRHNRRSEFLTFKFESNDQTIITGAVLNLFIRGQDWMREFKPDVMKQISSNETEPTLFLNIHRALRRTNSLNYTHTIQMTQIRHQIPNGLGKWIQIELKDLPKLWMDKEQDSNLIIVVKTKDDWMRHFIETGRNDAKGTEGALAAHIEVRTQLSPGRQKRSASLDCQESDNELRCCRYPLKVNFTSFGWSFVVAPTDFDAYFCNGECKLGFLPEHPHTHLAALTRSASPCCSPTKMSSLTLLYFNLEQHLVLSTIPNMTVEKCSCS